MFPKSKILSPNSNLATSQTVNVVISDTCKTTSDNTNKTSLSSAPCASAPLEHSPPSSSNLLTPTNPYSAIPNNESVVYQSPTDADVKSRAVNLTETPANISEKDKTDTIEFLKLLLKSYMNNPIKYNGYIICTVPLLEHLIELLTGCDNCEVITADPELNCCGKEISTHIVPVSKIWVKIPKYSNINIHNIYNYLKSTTFHSSLYLLNKSDHNRLSVLSLFLSLHLFLMLLTVL